MNRTTIASTPSPAAVVAAGEDATVTPRPNLAVDMNEKTTILGRLFYNSSSPVSSSSLRTTSKKTKKNSTVNSTDIRKHDVAIVPQIGGANKQTTTTTKRKQEEPSRSSSPFGPYDILCGREKNIFNHVGNRRFRMTIGMNIPHYEHAQNKTSKAHVIRDVTHRARNEIGYRFLKKKTDAAQQEQPVCITTIDPKEPNTVVEYIELTESEARKKVGHALRDMSVARHQLLARRKLRAQQRQQQHQHPNNLQEPVVPGIARVGALPSSSSQEMRPYPSVATSSTTMLMTGRPTPGVPAAVLTVLPSSTTTIYDVDDVHKVDTDPEDMMTNLSPTKIFDDRFEPLPVEPSVADGMDDTGDDDVDEDVATAAAFFPPHTTKQQQHAAATFAYTDLQLQREIVLTNRMLIMGAAHFEHQQQQAAAHYAQQQQQQAAAHYEQEQATVPRPDEVRTVPPTSPSRLVPGTSDGEKVTRRVSFTEEQLDRQEDAAAREEPHPHPPPPRVSPFGVLRARHYQQLQSQYEELQRKQHWVVQQQRWKKEQQWGHNPRPQSNSQQQPPPPLPSVSQPVAPARYEIDTVVAV